MSTAASKSHVSHSCSGGWKIQPGLADMKRVFLRCSIAETMLGDLVGVILEGVDVSSG
jgi:hypothetical protein